MKTIGLLTFHFPINYGAFLQTFGLYDYIDARGGNIEIINYFTDDHMARFDFYQKPKSFKEIFYYVLKTAFFPDYLKKRKKFKQFNEKYFRSTARYRELSEVSFSYDIVLTGSDQVFNINHKDRLIYFQPFEKSNGQTKAAYAPSFGINNLDENVTHKIQNFIQDFDYLSCREELGAQYLTGISNKEVKHVLDPVFLLDSERWYSISSKRLIQENYIFIYDLNGKKSLVDIAKRIARGRKIVIISNDPMAQVKSIYRGCDVFVKSAGIEDFISYIRYADIVVTDSFHGTAMSVLFRKEFYTFIALKSASYRILSLLKSLSLDRRLVNDLADFEEVEVVDYDGNLKEMIDKSKAYLDKILCN
jgi:hypothetical protein